MKQFLRIIAIFIVFIGVSGFANAKLCSYHISPSLKKANIPSSALVAISFKEITTAKKAFELNENVPMSPASIQKIVTLLPALDALGETYEFKTQLYKNSNNNLYLKLGADPYFTTSDLKSMIKSLGSYKISSTKGFYFDDNILDNNDWGEGWQWDDDLNPLIPKFGSYNMDKNLLTVEISPTVQGAPADISTNVFYPTAFINNIVTGTANDVKLCRKNYISPDVINADGTIASTLALQIPVNYPRRYFILRLEEILRQQKISYYGNFDKLALPKNTYLIAEIKHPLSNAVDDILKKSNNMMAETVFKIAGGKYINGKGTTEAAIHMFNDYYIKQGINIDDIKIVDGSGVSKNNLLTADFITNVLVKSAQNKDSYLESHMASPGEGTLTDRMLYFKDNLKAKTGTLTNISSIAGYLTAKNGKTYAFCIMINDAKSKAADKKALEEYLLRDAFASL